MLLVASELLDPKRNNFTLVRFVLASSVIYTHAFWMIYGVEGKDDLSDFLGVPISVYAVDGFFFLSGFLVYPSLLRLGKVSSFFVARLVRLWPALALSVGLTVLAGALVTTAGPASYFGGATAKFIGGNLSLLFASYHLTGVRCGAELCNVNGSLWTLPWEVRCYAILGLLSLVGLARPQMMARFVLPATLAAVLIWDLPFVQAWVQPLMDRETLYVISMMDRLWALFALGIAAYIFRERIPLSWAILALLFVINLAAHWIGAGMHVRALFIGYAVLCFGLLSAKRRALSGAWPDYSYGMYIFAFPLMIAVQAALQLESHLLLALINLLVTLPLAAFSWYVVEKPALDAFRGARSRAVPQTLLQP